MKEDSKIRNEEKVKMKRTEFEREIYARVSFFNDGEKHHER